MNTLRADSIGTLADRWQCDPRDIERAAERLGIHPALVLNSAPYYAAEDAGRLFVELVNSGAARAMLHLPPVEVRWES